MYYHKWNNLNTITNGTTINTVIESVLTITNRTPIIVAIEVNIITIAATKYNDYRLRSCELSFLVGFQV
jgi:hypothetical protein